MDAPRYTRIELLERLHELACLRENNSNSVDVVEEMKNIIRNNLLDEDEAPMFPFVVDIRNLDDIVDSLTADDLARYGRQELARLEYEEIGDPYERTPGDSDSEHEDAI